MKRHAALSPCSAGAIIITFVPPDLTALDGRDLHDHRCEELADGF
jgi:hypothetical protein